MAPEESAAQNRTTGPVDTPQSERWRSKLATWWEPVAVVDRRVALWVARAGGSLMRRSSRGWGAALWWLTVVALVLLLLPAALDWSLGVASDLGVWPWLGIDDEPNVDPWWTPLRVLLLAGGILVVQWLLRARERVVVEEFVDYTSADAQAVKGLATLLVAELGRLRDIYGRVNDQLSTPASVGVRAQSGARGTEAGAFLSVRADDVGEVLKGAVATEAKLDVGPLRIPIGPFVAGLGRLVRGPRVLGSVHRTEAGGGPTLTTQIAGLGGNFTWRVDGPETAVDAASKAFLNPMVSELALRMFTDLTLQRSVRWRAVRAFTAYLELYWDSLRTPKDRASNLKQAEARLLEAVAEDETFDLGFYNLGVVYSQLARAETRAIEASDHVGQGADPEAAFRARTDAATVAFSRSATLNRERPEAIYGLAVNTFTSLERNNARNASLEEAERTRRLRQVVHYCRRVIELDPRHAQAHDLKGMAEQELGLPYVALRSHRRAAARSWRAMCRLEYTGRARPEASEGALHAARANAAVALQNLASAHARAAARRRRLRARMEYFRAERLLHQSLSLTPADVRAASLLEQGAIREQGGRADRAAKSYLAAAQTDPNNPVCWARLRLAQAKHQVWLAQRRRLWRDVQRPTLRRRYAATEVELPPGMVLGLLAPIYRRTIEPHALVSDVQICDLTLATLEEAAKCLGDRSDMQRVRGLLYLHRRIRKAEAQADVTTLQRFEHQFKDLEDRHWEYEQIAVALGRTLGRAGRWSDAAEIYSTLIQDLAEWRPAGITQHSLHARRARALRKIGELEAALEEATDGVIQNPLSPSSRRELGKVQFALLQFDEALAAWEHTLWLTPNDPVLHWKVGFCHWCVSVDRQERTRRLEALASAQRNFEQAVLLSGPERLHCWAWSKLWLGRVCLEQGAPDAAVEHLRAAKGVDVTELPARLFLGEVHLATGEVWLSLHRLGQVYELAHQRVKDGQGDALVDHGWGRSLSMREAAARARFGFAYWAAVVDGRPGDGLALAIEAERLARQVRNVRGRALTLARCLDLKARIHAELGDLDHALAATREAAALHPAPDILLHELRLYEPTVAKASDALQRASLVSSAKEMVESIHRLEDDGPPAREADEVLRRLEEQLMSRSVPADGALPTRVLHVVRSRFRRGAGDASPQTTTP